jgi:Metallo-peptidase family M12B Reprolysin-like/Secretion system C-terminal sorting domain
MRKFLLASLILISTCTFAQTGFFTKLNENAVDAELFENKLKPAKFSTYQLKNLLLQNELLKAPNELQVAAARSSFTITVPGPNGNAEHFTVVEAPVMAPQLSAKYPGIYSYAGRGIDHPNSTIRFSMGLGNFSAMVLSTDRPTYYIDLLDQKKQLYIVFSRPDMYNYKSEFKCLTDDVIKNHPGGTTLNPDNADDGTLRTYRIAMASTGEFSQFWLNGTETTDAQRKAKVLAAMNNAMTRTNGIYERDFGIQMNLVANNDLIIYLDAATDPWTSNFNGVTQATIDNVIGDANYDIGHLVHRTSDNGNAGCIGCVCVSGSKGSAFTSYQNLNNFDWFVVDYLTHEIGHQFGGNHTHNHGGNEGTIAQVEPGSGSTIMGYAGITGVNTDVQPHSDDYFHAINIQQITNYTRNGTGNSCAATTNTGNAVPTANAGADFTIPISTPFTLTGSGTDANAGDVLSFCWEQNNVRAPGFSAIPSATATAGPQFRSFLPKATTTRTIPDLQYILTGANGWKWEVLPSVNRTLNFRFTVRDNKAGGGNNESDDMVVTITNTSGPFLVSSQNTTGISYNSGSSQTFTWSVNNTNLPPVSCANVAIELSTDGGQTFPIVLAANTANDGSEVVSIPNNPTTQARVRVRALGNIFFDINNANFTIVAANPDFEFATPAPALITCATQNSSTTVLGTTSILGYSTTVNLTATAGVPPGCSVNFSANSVTPGNSVDVTLTNTNTLAFGNYDITIQGVSGSITKTRVMRFTVQPGTGPTVTDNPVAQTVCAGGSVTFNSAATGATSQQWQVSTDGGSNWNNIPGATAVSLTLNSITALQNNYRYRCVYTGQCNNSNTTGAILTVQTAPAVTGQPANANICAGSNTTFTVAASGSSLTYQWQLSTDGGSNYNDIATATNASYTVTAATIGQNNNRYRCVVSGACPSPATSNGAILTVSNAVVINNQPANVTICAGGNTSFTVAATGSVVSYQWQLSTDGGSNWNNVSGTTATLSLTGVTAAQNNYSYRCIINGACNSVVSNGAVLAVQTSPSIITQPANASVCVLSNASFNVSATGSGLTYLWQTSSNAGTSWDDVVGTNLPVLNVVSIISGNNFRVRCIVSGACTPSVTSDAAILNVTAPVVINTQPADAALCNTGNISFSVNATGTNNFQWQRSTDGGASFNNIAAPSAATYNENVPGTNFNNYRYRVIVNNGVCPAVTSNAAVLSVNPLPVVILSAAPYTKLFPGLRTTVTANITPAGGTIQWQRNGTNISNTGNTLSVTVDSLGAYKVIVTGIGGCVGESAVLSILDSATSKIFFYPNPNQGQFQVRYNNPQSGSTQNYIRVFDGRGTKVFEQLYSVNAPYTQMLVNISARGSGIYLVELTDKSGKRLATGKVVIRW